MADTPRVEPARPPEPQRRGKRPSISAVDIVRVLVELFAFFTFAFWGFTSWPFPWNIVVGIAAPVAAILLWALFVSPKAVLAVHPFVRALVELAIFVTATIAWWSLGQGWFGLVFAIIAVASGVLSGRRRLQ